MHGLPRGRAGDCAGTAHRAAARAFSPAGATATATRAARARGGRDRRGRGARRSRRLDALAGAEARRDGEQPDPAGAALPLDRADAAGHAPSPADRGLGGAPGAVPVPPDHVGQPARSARFHAGRTADFIYTATARGTLSVL